MKSSLLAVLALTLICIQAVAFSRRGILASVVRARSTHAHFSMATTMKPPVVSRGLVSGSGNSVRVAAAAKPAPIVPVEKRTNRQMIVPSINELDNAVRTSTRTRASKEFCIKSCGYPNREVKEGVYLLLWSTMTKHLELEELKLAKAMAEKEGRKSDVMRYEADLAAFGLI